MGKIGDISGKIGDISGKIGDISGIEGKIGDISGGSLFQEVRDFLLQDRESDRLGCLELKVRRLQNEMLAITAWLDARITALEHGGPDVEKALELLGERIGKFEDLELEESLAAIIERLEKLEEPEPKRKSPNGAGG